MKEEKKEEKKRERERVKEEKTEKKETKKRARPYVTLTEEKKAALALAALGATRGAKEQHRGVGWDRKHFKWQVQLSGHGKDWHLGHFDFDDQTKAVAACSRHKSMTKTELGA